MRGREAGSFLLYARDEANFQWNISKAESRNTIWDAVPVLISRHSRSAQCVKSSMVNFGN